MDRPIRISIASQLDIIDVVEEDSKAIMLYADKSIYNMLKRSAANKVRGKVAETHCTVISSY